MDRPIPEEKLTHKEYKNKNYTNVKKTLYI
jgi:hypothetical protein